MEESYLFWVHSNMSEVGGQLEKQLRTGAEYGKRVQEFVRQFFYS